MISPEDPPDFVVRTEAQKAAWDNGFAIERGIDKGWLAYASTTAPGTIWIAGASMHGPWFLSLDHAAVAAELDPLPRRLDAGPGSATFVLETVPKLHEALDRVYRLAVSLPEVPLERFRKATRVLSGATEAERLVVQRIGQDIFRDALLTYWGGCCPLTGIADAALLRASHIVPWADCGDEQRLDVHNGLLLSALWDAAFDKGLVSFTDDGAPLVGPTLGAAARAALRADAANPIPSLRGPPRQPRSPPRPTWFLIAEGLSGTRVPHDGRETLYTEMR